MEIRDFRRCKIVEGFGVLDIMRGLKISAHNVLSRGLWPVEISHTDTVISDQDSSSITCKIQILLLFNDLFLFMKPVNALTNSSHHRVVWRNWLHRSVEAFLTKKKDQFKL